MYNNPLRKLACTAMLYACLDLASGGAIEPPDSPTQDTALRNGNLLACESYSFRALIQAGKLDVTTVPELYRQLGIQGISYNDRYFKRFDEACLDQVKAAVKKAGWVFTCYVLDGALATPNERERRQQIEADKEKLRVAYRLCAPLVRINMCWFSVKWRTGVPR